MLAKSGPLPEGDYTYEETRTPSRGSFSAFGTKPRGPRGCLATPIQREAAAPDGSAQELRYGDVLAHSGSSRRVAARWRPAKMCHGNGGRRKGVLSGSRGTRPRERKVNATKRRARAVASLAHEEKRARSGNPLGDHVGPGRGSVCRRRRDACGS